jgi:hypothetical protein
MLFLLVSCRGEIQGTDTPSPEVPAEPVIQVNESPAPTPMTFKASSSGNVSVAQLPIASDSGRISSYDRGDWGGWIDADQDCQNSRHEVLIEESLRPVIFIDARKCSVSGGYWLAPFKGIIVTAARDIDVDHMVPLANAHKSGGWAWDYGRKNKYANNLSYKGHLIAVTASANRSKGARGPEDWRPPDKNYWCQYAIDWISIKAAWGLTATSQEWKALVEMLGTCAYELTIGGQVETDHQSPIIEQDTLKPKPNEALRYDPFGSDRDCGDFDTWQEAQAFFEAAGGPNKDPHRLDGDNNGIACQSLPKTS